MAKMFIDTNVFLHFYDSNQPDKIQVLTNDLNKYLGYIVFPEQAYNEFLRNRVNVINTWISEYEKSSKIQPRSSTYINTLEEAKEVKKALDVYNANRDDLIKKIKSIRDNMDDAIFRSVNAIFGNDNVKIINITNEIIDKAWKRKISGNPPTSDKYTCCDEIIWESLLEHCKDDIAIISNDGTFKDNLFYLKADYFSRTGYSLIGVFDRITEGINAIGLKPQINAIEAEKDVYDEISEKEHHCIKCGSTGPWSGVMCLNCGYKDQDTLYY